PPGGQAPGPGTPQSEPPSQPGVPRPDEPVTGPVVPRSADERLTGPVLPGPGTELERHTGRAVVPHSGAELTPSWANVISTTVRLWVQRRRTGWRVVSAIVLALIVFVG